MKQATIYQISHEISRKLSEFNVTKKELREVALDAMSARNEATPLHPSNAPGTFSYMAGVAALRMVFLRKHGWNISRCKGVEAVVNTDLGTVILFQNVDFACGMHDPNPVTGKGEGVTEIVDNPSGLLWDYMTQKDKKNENKHVWFYCVSSHNDQVRAELSRPRAIKNGNFGTFAERIFIIQDSDWSLTNENPDKDFDNNEGLEISVTKKG